MTQRERDRFDALLEGVLSDLPLPLHELIQEVPVIVEDRPSRKLLRELAEAAGEPDDWAPDELCGLHSGPAFTERSVADAGELPNDIRLFREGIIAQAGGWAQEEADGLVAAEIRITLLHEIGHQFGLGEDDLDRLGYQ